MSNLKPLVSVYIPTHNRAKLLERAVMSVLNQTYKNIEVIICNDASQDNTEVVLTKFANMDSRVRFISNESPQGACYSRNRCINLASGEFITGLDDDDEFMPERIERFVNIVRELNKSIICSNRVFKSSQSENIGHIYTGDINIGMMSSRNWVGNQIFTKTKYIKELHGFDESFPAWQDYDMWFRVINMYGACYRDSKPTYIFYVDDDRPRITTSSRSHMGYRAFILKHNDFLSKTDIKNLHVQDMINRQISISFSDVIKNFTAYNFGLYLRSYFKKIHILKILYLYVSGKKNYESNRQK